MAQVRNNIIIHGLSGSLGSQLVIKQDNLKQISLNNPFLQATETDISKLHVTFLNELPSKENLEKLNSANAGNDKFEIINDVVYLHCPDGYGNTKLNNTFFENKLKVRATTRNWNTVIKLSKLYE